MHIDDNLKWETHTWSIIKKSRMRLHLLKHLKNYGAPKHDLVNFYKSIIRPVLEYGDVLWTGGITVNHIYSGITYKLGESTETCNENDIPGIDL